MLTTTRARGQHTSVNSRRSRIIERAIDVQVLTKQRVAADPRESQLLREAEQFLEATLRRLRELRSMDLVENEDHEVADRAARAICEGLESETAGAATPAAAGD